MKFWPVFKEYAHQVSVAVALFLILTTGLIVEVRLMRGDTFPDGYGEWFLMLFGLAGVNVAGMGFLRATSPKLAAIKAAGKAGQPQVNVAGDANVQTAATAEHAIPQAGASDDGAVG